MKQDPLQRFANIAWHIMLTYAGYGLADQTKTADLNHPIQLEKRPGYFRFSFDNLHMPDHMTSMDY